MNVPSHSTVEALLSQLEGITHGSKQRFELWVPQQLTLRGQPVLPEVAMAIILDKILCKGYEPDGFAEAESGRIYRYKVSC
jgi:hypothetical protein